MATFVPLEKLIYTIAGAVMEAQNLVEKAQLRNIASFFDDKLRPVAMDVELPSLGVTAAEGQYDRYRVPLLSLIPHSSLVISEAEIDLDVELSGISEEEAPARGAMAKALKGHAAESRPKPFLMVNPEGKKNGNTAHITLKLAGSDPAEGLARLLTEVTKLQGIVGAADTDDPPPSA